MREIKFRAWNTREQYMTLEALGLNGEGTQRFQSLTHNSLNLETGEIVWMQFTGLKDKNGKEIYEGDIILHKFRERIPGGKRGKMVEKRFEVRWHAPQFVLGETERMHQEFYHGEDYEVVGNIYENPELLK